MARLPYRIVDVFTDRPFAGNPLAVVFDADDLSTEQLAALAREFNLSETAFPLPPDRAGADYRLRIFMPVQEGKELPFAGHPSVGAAWVLATDGRLAVAGPSTTVHMSCGAGVLPIVLTVDPDGRIGEVELTAGTPSAGPPLPSSTSSAVLAALGLDGSAAAPGRAMRVCSTGLAQAFLCVRESVLADVRVDVAALAAVASEGGWDTISVFSWDSAVAVAHARVFADGLGWGEDPATGSAGSAFGAWLVAEGLATTDGEFAYVIEQGVEMGRPSRISGTVVASGGQPLACRVAGRVASVASGLIEVPTAPPPHTDGRVSGTVVTRVTE